MIIPYDSPQRDVLAKQRKHPIHRIMSDAQSAEHKRWCAEKLSHIPDYKYNNDSYAEWIKIDNAECNRLRREANHLGLDCEIAVYD